VIGTATLLAGCGQIPPVETPPTPDGPGSSVVSSPPAEGSETCEYVATGKASRPVDLPPATGVPTSGTVQYVLKLSSGEVKITMDRSKAPCTVNSFVSLADQQFFDKTDCHRLVDSGLFLLQCGDPTGTGDGGPGYQFANETDGTEKYQRGVVAMANAGPDTNGSQFLLLWDDSSSLDAEHEFTIFGEMDTASADVVAAIASQGRDGEDRPIEPAKIISVSPQ
jgi:cyclophilin family peptidyl-prolyl cis-trans isomerase